MRGDRDAAAVLELDQDFTGQDFLGKDTTLAVARDNSAAHLRQLGVEFLIYVLLKT